LRVFEVDFPATQQWKRALLAEAAIAIPTGLTFVPLDFEHKTLSQGLADAGFDAAKSAFFGWLGVVPYLTLAAFRSTLDTIAALPATTAVSFDYALSPQTLSPLRRMAFHALAARVEKPANRSSSSSHRTNWTLNLSAPASVVLSNWTPRN
jgi:methyltransferase (TIGR00027 family)